VELLEIAVVAAREAGELLGGVAAGRVEVAATKSSPTDVVTEMDRRSEELITRRLLAARPADAILAEEGGASGQGTGSSGVRWVIDPIDGTVNYLYGLADWSVSIAAEVAGTVVAGVVHMPRHGETFTATLGGGAWLSRQAPAVAVATAPAATAPVALRARPGVPLSQALVATGFGYLAARREIQGEVVAALLPRVRDIRRGGSASVDLCSVAAGRVDAYYERGLNYWDYAAGALIAAEAGAMVAGLSGPAGGTMTIAAAPSLYVELSAALAALRPERGA
jgi:myo-inositol-1(or 4)-monophosphatase